MNDYSDKDVEFVKMMISHHESAVAAALREYSDGKSKDVRKWAHEIFTGQRKEIAKFKSWLADRGISASSAMKSK